MVSAFFGRKYNGGVNSTSKIPLYAEPNAFTYGNDTDLAALKPPHNNASNVFFADGRVGTIKTTCKSNGAIERFKWSGNVCY